MMRYVEEDSVGRAHLTVTDVVPQDVMARASSCRQKSSITPFLVSFPSS